MSTQPQTPMQSGMMPPPGPPPQVNPFTAGTPTGGIPAYGTVVQVRSSTSPEAFTTIAGMGDLTGPANSMGEVDVTSHSTGVPIKQTIPGLIDLGDLSFPCYWDPADPTQNINSAYGLEYLFFNRIVTKWQLINPNATHRTRQFYGFVKSLAEDSKVAGVMTRNVAIRITSLPTDVASAIAANPNSFTAVAATGSPTDLSTQITAGGLATPWSAIPSDTWLHVTLPTTFPQTGDQSVKIKVDANPNTGVPRTGTVTISGLNLTITVDQLG